MIDLFGSWNAVLVEDWRHVRVFQKESILELADFLAVPYKQLASAT
jgi:hypothetical protein